MLAKLVWEVGAVETKEAISHPCQLNGDQKKGKAHVWLGWPAALASAPFDGAFWEDIL